MSVEKGFSVPFVCKRSKKQVNRVNHVYYCATMAGASFALVLQQIVFSHCCLLFEQMQSLVAPFGSNFILKKLDAQSATFHLNSTWIGVLIGKFLES